MEVKSTHELHYSTLKVWMLPCLSDNYIFIIYNKENGTTIVIDPAEGLLVDKFLNYHQLNLNEIWITHHHPDHISGIPYLTDKYNCIIRGSTQIPNRIPRVNISMKEKIFWNLGHFNVSVLEVPGHTLDHLAYWIRDEQSSLLFSGDVLFGFGCGRLFEGSYEQMISSLKKIIALPVHTQVFCSHEYTMQNLEFSLTQISGDKKIEERKLKVQNKVYGKKPTVPLDLKEEIETNLFLRAIQSENPLEEFRSLRIKKDEF